MVMVSSKGNSLCLFYFNLNSVCVAKNANLVVGMVLMILEIEC
jgi:hypothetical protein